MNLADLTLANLPLWNRSKARLLARLSKEKRPVWSPFSSPNCLFMSIFRRTNSRWAGVIPIVSWQNLSISPTVRCALTFSTGPQERFSRYQLEMIISFLETVFREEKESPIPKKHLWLIHPAFFYSSGIADLQKSAAEVRGLLWLDSTGRSCLAIPTPPPSALSGGKAAKYLLRFDVFYSQHTAE